ncbi:DExH-box ATP-dependent RNA helicase DExH6 [Primulina huaijiensis]|uniref:DExH-box ATP-dependent RNA helicase DExH6 n=1 Tax=Primulina huaijiensis TaxID=1492673 RepID=UPI003CC74F60
MATSSSAGGIGKKRQKKGRNPQEVTNVAESTRIQIAQILENFRTSNDDVYTFQENLTNRGRASVHMLCRKMGMSSKSSGRGEQRRVSVYKTKKGLDPVKGKENVVSFRFSKDTKDVLQDFFSRYPPDAAEVADNKHVESSGTSDRVRGKRDDIFAKSPMTNSEIANKLETLASRIEKDPNLRQIAGKRSKLPIAPFKDVITQTVESHQVVLICGETGCGKTTQVPQFLLDHAWSKGETCKIVCTQPRRISATSVAERIASERGENVGNSVGYKIRLESKGGRHSSLVFCTNGVLLRVLIGKGIGRTNKKDSKKMANGVSVSDITHIIVDEIHERDRFSDFMLAIIRDMLHSYPHLRLVLMSATIDAERFSKYFGGCPIVQVPGFTYPVKALYLEDVLSIVQSTGNNDVACLTNVEDTESSILTGEYKIALDEAIDLALSSDEFDPLLEFISSGDDPKVFNYQHSKTGETPLMVFAQKGRVADICMLLSFGVDCHLRSKFDKTALDFAEQDNHREAAEIIKKHMEKPLSYSDKDKILLEKYMANVDPELIDFVLIEKLLRRICDDSKDGAILIFLPGWDDINRTRERLLASHFFKDSSKFVIISLHSLVPAVEQRKVFRRPAPGCRKIVLSTNIAETSVTIEDVVYVIDSGRMKEKSYDPYNNVSTLHSSWISKASAKQREGRAGRCQPGICYHLYSKLRASSLPDFQVPEIKRMPIEELCLQVKLVDPSCKIEDFLQKTLDSPVYETIRNAISVLQDIGALTSDEKLTDLGEKLGSLPVHPLTSKMLFVAILLNCLDPALTLACASDYRDPFILPILPDERKRAAAAKLELASFYGGHGDQLAIIAAFECWKMACENGDEARFCSRYFISPSTMKMISGMRKQLEAELVQSGFILEDASRCSLNAQDPGIIHAIVVAGLYPLVGRLLAPTKSCKRAIVETAGGNKVRLHPHSTNFKLSLRKCTPQPLIIFDEITRGDGGLHIRNCTVVGPLPLLLLAKEIVVAPSNENDDEDDESDYEDVDAESDEDKTGSYDLPNFQRGEKFMSSPDNSVKVVIDSWLPFESTALDVAQIYCLRERLSSAILFKVRHPRKLLPEHLGASLYAIACSLSYDGMSGITLPLEPVDSLASMISATDISNPNHGKKTGMNQLPKHNPTYHGRHQNFASHQGGGMNRREKLAPQSSSAVAHESVIYGTHSKGNCSKRQRGNGLR